jgi:ribonuclease P protein component
VCALILPSSPLFLPDSPPDRSLRRRALPSISAASVFAHALKQRPQARSGYFALYIVSADAQDQDQDRAMLGLVVPKRSLRFANDRNRIKRVAREVFRLQQHRLYPAHWVVRLVKTPAWAQQSPREFRHNCRAEIEALLIQIRRRDAPLPIQ